MLEEDAEIWVGLWINGGLEHRKENVLQHLAKVGHKVPASENVTKIERGHNRLTLTKNYRHPFSKFAQDYWMH